MNMYFFSLLNKSNFVSNQSFGKCIANTVTITLKQKVSWVKMISETGS